MRHVSHLELDRWLLGAASGEHLEDHLSHCSACSEHVEGARKRLAELASAPLPDWVGSLAEAAPAREAERRPWWPRWRPLAPMLLGGALLAGAALVIQVMGDAEDASGPGYVASKGSPSVGVYVKRDERVFLWDGMQRVRVGDRIRLGIAPSEYRYVAVLSPSAAGLVPLYQSAVNGALELPVAWAIDAAGDAERLVVVLSQRPLSHAELGALAEGGPGALPNPAEAWVVEYVLYKQRGIE